jgi:phosphatidylglycerol:prolipoprotein diacylglycerol transferase
MATLQAAGVYQGGLLLAVLTAAFYIRRYQLPGLATADVFAPGIAIGHSIGRLGCFSAGCCWGKECSLPWAVKFTSLDAHQLTGVPLETSLHPTQLYESGAELLIFLFLWRYIHRDHRDGTVIGWYMVLYSIVRYLVEFVRNHEQELIAGLSLTQWISLGTLLAGIWLVVRPGAPVTRTPLPSRT